jgi:hypothetical protein
MKLNQITTILVDVVVSTFNNIKVDIKSAMFINIRELIPLSEKMKKNNFYSLPVTINSAECFRN